MKKFIITSIAIFYLIGLSLFGSGIGEDTSYVKTILERNDSVSTYFQQVVDPFTLKNGPLQLTAVPLLSETYVLSEYPEMKKKRYSSSKMVGDLEELVKVLDYQQEMSGIFLVFLRYERSEELLGMSSFTIDPRFFEFMFLDNDRGDFLRVDIHSIENAETVDAYNNILEFWVAFGEDEEERKKFFQESKSISISVTDFGFEDQVISYEMPISGMFIEMPKEPQELITSIRSSLTVTFDGSDTPAMTGQTFGSIIGEPSQPSREGYSFGGWFTDNLYTKAWNFNKDVILNDMTLYAKWTVNEYSVTLDSQGGSGGTGSITVGYGDSMPSAIAPTRSGFIFDGYYDDLDGKGTAYYSNSMKSLKTWEKAKSAILFAKWRDLTVGDISPSGGYIFFDKGSYSDGWRYLEAAPKDYEYSDKVWGGYGTNIGGAETAIGMGEANTQEILAILGNNEPFEMKADYAAKVCSDLVVTKDGVVYDDWFLPSLDELDLMWQNLYRKGIGGFIDETYWSSSEEDKNAAWGQNFFSRKQFRAIRHSYAYRVRPVRAF